MVDVAVGKLAREFGGEVVHVHGHGANACDEEIVTEHGGNGDEQPGDGGDERGGDAGGHGGEICGTGGGDIAEGIHDAPDGAEEAEKGRAADCGGEEDHLGLESQRAFADGALHGGLDGPHLGCGDGRGDLEAGAEGFIDFGGTEEVEGEFLAARDVNVVQRGPIEAGAECVKAQRLAVRPEMIAEIAGLALARAG